MIKLRKSNIMEDSYYVYFLETWMINEAKPYLNLIGKTFFNYLSLSEVEGLQSLYGNVFIDEEEESL